MNLLTEIELLRNTNKTLSEENDRLTQQISLHTDNTQYIQNLKQELLKTRIELEELKNGFTKNRSGCI